MLILPSLTRALTRWWQDDDRQGLVGKDNRSAIDRDPQSLPPRPVVDDEKILAVASTVAPNVQAVRYAPEPALIEVDRLSPPPPRLAASREGEGERPILWTVGLAVLRRVDDVELRAEKERLTLRPVVRRRAPPATVPVALAQKEDAVVQEVAAERRERGPWRRAVQLGRGPPWTAIPAPSTERAADEEGGGIDVDGILDDRSGVELVLQQRGDAKRISEVTVAENVDVEGVGSICDAVPIEPVVQEREVRRLRAVEADERPGGFARPSVEPDVPLAGDAPGETFEIRLVALMEVGHRQAAAGVLGITTVTSVEPAHLPPELHPGQLSLPSPPRGLDRGGIPGGDVLELDVEPAVGGAHPGRMRRLQPGLVEPRLEPGLVLVERALPGTHVGGAAGVDHEHPIRAPRTGKEAIVVSQTDPSQGVHGSHTTRWPVRGRHHARVGVVGDDDQWGEG